MIYYLVKHRDNFMGEMGNEYITLVGQPEGKRLFRRPRHRWKDNVKKDLREIWWEGVDWMHAAQDRPSDLPL
jgi:hypothetical protein